MTFKKRYLAVLALITLAAYNGISALAEDTSELHDNEATPASIPPEKLTCDVRLFHGSKTTGKEADRGEVILNGNYFTYSAPHGNGGDSTGNNIFDDLSGQGSPKLGHSLKLINTDANGTQIYENAVYVVLNDEPNKYVYTLRAFEDGHREFTVNDKTSHTAVEMTHCQAQ